MESCLVILGLLPNRNVRGTSIHMLRVDPAPCGVGQLGHEMQGTLL
jgi:hypothetical protein